MNLLLVRHGETQWNRREAFRGRADIELDEGGREQARLLAEYLRGREIDRILASPLKRAVETARILAVPHDLPVEFSPELTDFDYGRWQGVLKEDISRREPELWRVWENAPEAFRAPGGETLDDVQTRINRLLAELAPVQGTALIVTHRVVLKIMILALLGLDASHFWNVKIDTCSLTTFTREKDRYVLVEHNNTCFLKVHELCPDF